MSAFSGSKVISKSFRMYIYHVLQACRVCTRTYIMIFIKSSHTLIKLQNEITIRVVLLVYTAIGMFHLSHCTIGELVDDAVFGTNDHLSVDYMVVTYIRYFCVEINISTDIIPPSTLPLSCMHNCHWLHHCRYLEWKTSSH